MDMDDAPQQPQVGLISYIVSSFLSLLHFTNGQTQEGWWVGWADSTTSGTWLGRHDGTSPPRAETQWQVASRPAAATAAATAADPYVACTTFITLTQACYPTHPQLL